jgi:hypothetical protein
MAKSVQIDVSVFGGLSAKGCKTAHRVAKLAVDKFRRWKTPEAIDKAIRAAIGDPDKAGLTPEQIQAIVAAIQALITAISGAKGK